MRCLGCSDDSAVKAPLEASHYCAPVHPFSSHFSTLLLDCFYSFFFSYHLNFNLKRPSVFANKFICFFSVSIGGLHIKTLGSVKFIFTFH